MRASREDCPLACPSQSDLNTLQRLGIDIMALATPVAMQVAHGNCAEDGLFEADPSGARWYAFQEFAVGDIVFWHYPSGRLVSWCGRAFALGEDVIGEPATYSFDCALNIYDSPIDWLLSRRDGIVILPREWPTAFDRLRDCPRIALAERLLPVYRSHMKPRRLPELSIIPELRRAA